MAKKLHKDSFDNNHFKKVEMKAHEIGKIYRDAINDILKGFKLVDVDPNKFFAFKDYPQYKEKMGNLFEKLSKNVTTEVNKQSKESWEYAEKKNQELLKGIMKKFGIKKLDLRNKYSKSNLEALRAFQTRKEKGLNLSNKVWNQTQSFQKEIELSLDTALRDGKSAAEISRDVKKYLNDPDRLFRRVRDHHGNLGLSKAAKQVHPGRGVYRSSSKNAMRLARTENNMAYHESNYQKYKEFDFIIGMEVKLSNNSHHCPFCEAMQGTYPKAFKFLGWHPHCRCTTVPILKSKSEMQKDDERLIQGKQPERSQNEVLNTPQAYREYIEKNQTKLDSMPNKPYWYKDNSNLKESDPVEIKIKKVKSQADKDLIQTKWDDRNKVHEGIKKNAVDTIQEFEDWGFAIDSEDDQIFELKADLKANKLFKINQNLIGYKNFLNTVKTSQFDEWSQILPKNTMVVGKHPPQEIFEALDSAKNKMSEWKASAKMIGLTPESELAWIKKKLNFEIGYVESKQTFGTWKVSQEFYQKALFQIDYESLVLKADEQILFLKKELKKNPTKKGTKFIEDLESLKTLSLNTESSLSLEIFMTDVESYIDIRKGNKAPKVKTSGIKGKLTYSDERLNAVTLEFDPQVPHDNFIDITSKRWGLMDLETKQTLWSYTNSSGKINRPLRGFEDGWSSSKFRGVGKVKLDHEAHSLNTVVKGLDLNKGIPKMAKEIENHVFKQDTWLRRGEDMKSFIGRFGIDLDDFVGKFDEIKGIKGIEEAFLSTSPARNKGFSEKVQMEIFAPKGTQGIYVEPFSHYGHGKGYSTQGSEGLKWDGSKKLVDASSEFELIVNQGYEMEIISVSKSGNIYDVKVALIKRKSAYKF